MKAVKLSWTVNTGMTATLTMDQAREFFGLIGTPDAEVVQRINRLFPISEQGPHVEGIEKYATPKAAPNNSTHGIVRVMSVDLPEPGEASQPAYGEVWKIKATGSFIKYSLSGWLVFGDSTPIPTAYFHQNEIERVS